MGLAGLVRLEAEAKNSSEKERMREVKGAEIRSVDFLVLQQWFRAISAGTCRLEKSQEGGLPMQVVPKVLSICSGGMESGEVDWTS